MHSPLEKLTRNVGDWVLQRSALRTHVNKHLSQVLWIVEEELVHHDRGDNKNDSATCQLHLHVIIVIALVIDLMGDSLDIFGADSDVCHSAGLGFIH